MAINSDSEKLYLVSFGQMKLVAIWAEETIL